MTIMYYSNEMVKSYYVYILASKKNGTLYQDTQPILKFRLRSKPAKLPINLLNGYMAMQTAWSKDSAKFNRIVVMNIQGFSGLIPIAYVEKVRGMECVACALANLREWGKFGLAKRSCELKA